MGANPDGRGYWMVARDGGLFGFGSAGFFGSEGSGGLSQPVVDMTVSPSGKGYWMVSSGVLAGPSDFAPVVGSPLPGEGHWTPTSEAVGGSTVLYTSFAQAYQGADPTALAWMQPQLLKFALYAGTSQPSGNWSNEGSIPPGLRSQLVAAFNSGFMLSESRGGWYLDHTAALPLVNGAASLVIFADGTATVGQWGRDAFMTPKVVAVRQNLNLLVDNGQIASTVGDIQNSWGAVLGGGPTTWRSALGIDRSGHLIYAAGPNLDPAGLARVMVAAGALRAMELDINPMWALFISYPSTGPAELRPGMYFPPDHYFTPYTRDFIAVFARP